MNAFVHTPAVGDEIDAVTKVTVQLFFTVKGQYNTFHDGKEITKDFLDRFRVAEDFFLSHYW